jgi:hypothetical protein
MKLLVSLPENSINLAIAALEGGADGVKIHLNAYHRASGANFGTFEQELPFLEALAKLPGEKYLMAGQDTVPSASEMKRLKDFGFLGFNLYLRHLQPHLFESGMTPILALEHGFTEEDFQKILAVPGAAIEASCVDFAKYGTALEAEDLRIYSDVVSRSGRTVLIPSQKKFLTSDVSALKQTGAAVLLLGVIVVGRDSVSIMNTTRDFRIALESSAR